MLQCIHSNIYLLSLNIEGLVASHITNLPHSLQSICETSSPSHTKYSSSYHLNTRFSVHEILKNSIQHFLDTSIPGTTAHFYVLQLSQQNLN